MDQKRSEDCPSLEQLAEYVELGRSSQHAEKTEHHLARCPACANWVREAEANDAIIQDVFDQDTTVILGLDGDSDATGLFDEDQQDLVVSGELACAILGYEIIEQIGRGGMGVVYKAIQLSAKREVALKVLLDGPFASRKSKRRFEREVELAAQLDHPSIVTVLDSGVSCGRHYFAMQYIEGSRLDAHVASARPNLRTILMLFSEICAAVSYAHQRGVIHRDLKPSNIRVDKHGVPHILDFGLAKVVTDSTDTSPESLQMSVTGQLLGTLPYMSPEQATGDRTRIDVRTDVYALGVILYELLTGQYPYPVAGHVTDVIRNISEATPEPPNQWLRPNNETAPKTWRKWEIDNDVETIVLTALAKDPAERYQSAQHLRQDIERYLAHEPIEAKRNSAWYVFKKAIWRHRIAAGVAISFLIVIVAGLIVSYTQWRTAVAERDLANRRLYINLVALADSSQKAGQSDRAKHKLDQCPQNLRSFEWYWLQQNANRCLQTIRVENCRVETLEFSPDSGKLAVGTALGLGIYAINREAAQLVHRLPFEGLCDVSFSSTGQQIAAITKAEASYWDLLAGARVWSHSYKSERLVDVQCCSPNDVLVISRNGANAFVKHGQNGEISSTLTDYGDSLWSAKFAGSDCSIAILDFKDGSIEERTASSGFLLTSYDREYEKHLSLAAISSNRSLIAYVGEDGRSVLLREQKTGKQLHSLTIPDYVPRSGILFSPDGSMLASICRPYCQVADDALALWDVETGELQVLFTGHSNPITSCAFSNDGKLIATGDTNGEIRLWNTHARSRPVSWFHYAGEAPGYPSIAVSNDGRWYASRGRDNCIFLWNAETGIVVHSLTGHQDRPHTIDFTSDGSRLISGGEDRTLGVWDTASGKRIALVDDFESAILSAVYSPDDRLILTGETNKTIRVLDANTGEELTRYAYYDDKGRPRAYISIDVSPDSKRFIASGSSPIVYVRDIATGTVHAELCGCDSVLHLAMFSPDGNLIAAAGKDQTARIWDAATGKSIHVLHGHVNQIQDVAFNSDGNRLATIDPTHIRIWDVESGQELLAMETPGERGCFVRFDPKRIRLISIDRNNVLHIWDAAPDPWPYPDNTD